MGDCRSVPEQRRRIARWSVVNRAVPAMGRLPQRSSAEPVYPRQKRRLPASSRLQIAGPLRCGSLIRLPSGAPTDTPHLWEAQHDSSALENEVTVPGRVYLDCTMGSPVQGTFEGQRLIVSNSWMA